MNIAAELHRHQAVKEALLADFPDIDEDTLRDTLEGCTDLQEMLVAVLKAAHEDECRIEVLEKQIGKLKERADRFQARSDKARANVARIMEEAGIKKIAAPELTASLRRVPPKVVITDEASLPADYCVIPPPRPDKALIKKAIEDGYVVPGASMSNGGISLSVRYG
jgi:hypothetical protein